MKKILIFLLIAFSQSAQACQTVEQAQKMALTNNSFLILYFSETSTFNFRKAKEFFWLKEEDAELLDHFYQFTVYNDDNKKYLQKYNIKELPTVLIVDGNGKEIYRYNDYSNPAGMKQALQNFIIPKHFLINDLNNFYQKKTFDSAVRIAQLYLDYSLKVELQFRQNVFNVSQSYLDEAAKMLRKKRLGYPEFQKLELVKLAQLAYQKDFVSLNEKLTGIDAAALAESNTSIYYFLRYITTKALKTADFLKVEHAAMQVKDFDHFSKKADLILSEKYIPSH